MCIETNVRASRSFPFVSKTMGVDFIEAATRAMVNVDTSDMNLPTLETRDRPNGYVGVKAPMFSFTRLRGSDPVLGVEMASTGEVACFGKTREEAFLKALLSTGFKMPQKNILVSVQESLQDDFTHSAWQLIEQGYTLYATEATANIMQKNKVPCTVVAYPTEEASPGKPSCIDLIKSGEIGMVINIPTHESKRLEDNFQMRRTAVDFGVPLLTNTSLVKVFANAVQEHDRTHGLEPKTLFEHYQAESSADAWTSPDEFH
jgi:carbamoyl-phosphate synthase (ammonia)